MRRTGKIGPTLGVAIPLAHVLVDGKPHHIYRHKAEVRGIRPRETPTKYAQIAIHTTLDSIIIFNLQKFLMIQNFFML